MLNKELVQKLIESKKFKFGVFCFVSRVSEENALLEQNSKIISVVDDEGFKKIHHTINRYEVWQYAVPYNPRTGKIIIDFNPETREIVTE